MLSVLVGLYGTLVLVVFDFVCFAVLLGFWIGWFGRWFFGFGFGLVRFLRLLDLSPFGDFGFLGLLVTFWVLSLLRGCVICISVFSGLVVCLFV